MNGELQLVSLAGLFPSKVLMLGLVCLWSEGFPPFLSATVWC